MKRIALIIYIIASYVVLILGMTLFTKITTQNWKLLLMIIGAVMFAAWLAVIICTLRSISIPYSNNLEEIKRIRIYKTVMIPWYFINFGFWVFLAGGFLNPFLMMFIPLLIIIGIGLTYASLMTTSLMAVAEVVRLKRAGLISSKYALKLAVFQFIFILDIAGAIMIYKTEKRALEGIRNT